MFGLKEVDEYKVITTVDINDADYLTRVSIIKRKPLEDFLNFFISEMEIQKDVHTGITFEYDPYVKVIEDSNGMVRISNERYIDKDMYFFIVNNIVPHNEYGMHTIVSVEVSPHEESVIFKRNK